MARPLLSRPVYLVGSERSGTTMLRLMLDAHPEVAFFSEFEFAVDHVTPDGGFPSVAVYRQRMSRDRGFHDSGFDFVDTDSYPEVVDGFLRQKRERDGKPVVGATVHMGFDRLRHVWPDCRFIHLIRDGRDVARSCVPMGWNGNAWGGAERWLEAERAWDRIEPTLREDEYVEVRFEDLVTRPQRELERVCEFLGVGYDEAMLGYADETTYDRPDPRIVQKWRGQMAEREVREVEAKIGPMLRNRGYELSGLEPLELNEGERRRLDRADRWGRRLFGVRRYGLGLTLLDNLARRLPLDPLKRYTHRRRVAVERRHLK